jgi:fatty acid desaturase
MKLSCPPDMKRSRLKKDTLYKVVIALGYTGAMTLLIFSKFVQLMIVILAGFLMTLLFYKLIK